MERWKILPSTCIILGLMLAFFTVIVMIWSVVEYPNEVNDSNKKTQTVGATFPGEIHRIDNTRDNTVIFKFDLCGQSASLTVNANDCTNAMYEYLEEKS